MPIYAYKCQACGHAKDVLQKMSDPLLTQCPACGKSEFQKQLTAAGFQLKGSGWYVTDFRDGNKGAGKTSDAAGSDAKTDNPAGEKADGKTDAKTDVKAQNQGAESNGKSEAKPDSAASSASPAPSAPAASGTPSASAP